MVIVRESQIGGITVLDESVTGTVDVTGAELINISGIIYDSVTSTPGNNSFWVQSGSPTLPKFTNSDGYTISLSKSTNSIILDDPTEDDQTAIIQAAIDEAGQIGGIVLFSYGTYRITDTLIITNSITLCGQIGTIIEIDSSNKTMVRILSSAPNTIIEKITFYGDQTGLGGLTSSNVGGHGIAIDEATGTVIRQCTFEKMGLNDLSIGSYACPIAGIGNQITIMNCNFANTCVNYTGADVFLSGDDLLVTNNRSQSYCDSHISFGNGLRHTAIGNFATRAADSVARSGILAFYDINTPTNVLLDHNQLSGFYWHGIYLAAQENSDAGEIIISNNQISFCGGGWHNRLDESDSPSGPWIGAGIKVSGRGVSISGNTILYCGYSGTFDAPVLRPGAGLASGICCLNFAQDVAISGSNVVRYCSGGGIVLNAQSTTTSIKRVVVSNNIVEKNLTHGISVSAQGLSVECLTDVTVSNNIVRVTEAASEGIQLAASNGGWANRIDFCGNQIIHETPPGSGSVPGISRPTYTNYTRFTGKIVGNTISGFRRGISMPSASTMYAPSAVLISGNRIEDAAEIIYFGGVDTNLCLHFDTTATTGLFYRAVPGRIIGVPSSGRPKVEFYYNLLPSTGTWIVGDRMILNGRRGSLVGYECVTAGTPGLWVPIYADIGFGVKSHIRASFGQTSFNVSGLAAGGEGIVGAATARTMINTNRYTRTPLVEYLDTSAGTDSVAGIRYNQPDFIRSPNFYTRLIWGVATGTSVSTRRAFAGMLADGSTPPTDVEPSSQVNMLGMGWDAADTQVQVMYSNASGPAVKVALGASFPRPTADRTTIYSLEIYCGGSGGAPIFTVTNLVSGARVEVFGAVIDSPGGALIPFSVWSSVGGTSGVAGVAFGSFEGWWSE